MKVTYDPEVDALYVRFVDEGVEVTTQRLTDDVAIDYGPNGAVVGIEILDATENVFSSGSGRNVLLENLTAISK